MSSSGGGVGLKEELDSLMHIFDENELKCGEKNITITLSPSVCGENEEVHTKIDLRVNLPEGYPKIVPDISLQNSKGLSNEKIEVLYGKLKELAEKLKGKFMIYDLALCVKEYLAENNKPGNKSFYEERLLRIEHLEQQKYEKEEDKRKKEMLDLQEKINQKLMSDSDVQWNEEEEEDIAVDVRNGNGKIVRFGNNSNNDKPLCDHNNTKYINFHRKVLRGRCIEHDTNSIVYCALDNTSGEQVIIREWVIKPKESKEPIVQNIRKQLDSVQQELNYLKNLKHENIISYVDFKYVQEKNEFTVWVVQEAISNVNLNVLVEKQLKLDEGTIRCLITGILSAINYLHAHNKVHKCLNTSCIYFDKSGAIKVGNHSIIKRIDDIYQYSQSGRSSILKDRLNQKHDIQQLGYLLLNLMGLNESDVVVAVPDSLPSDLKDFIEKCLIENEEKRWEGKQLMTHRFIKRMPKSFRFKRNLIEARRNSESKPGETLEELDLPILSTLPKGQSRLHCEFDVLEEIGSGSFGKVLKARNHLDKNIYAIKVIELNPRSKQLNRKIIREVQLLSKLIHENVVRYYSSWIEVRDKDDSTKITTTPLQTLTDKRSYKLLECNSLSVSKSGMNGLDEERNNEEEDDDDDDDDDDDEDEDDEDEEEDGNVNSEELNKEVETSDSIVFKENSTKASENCDSEEPDCVENQTQILYMQMEFCEKNTLRKAIDDGLCKDENRSWRLFREITEGLSYIHEQNMIHRDLKPVNIFLDSEDRVKIGDFGLATRSVMAKEIIGQITGLSNSGGESEVTSLMIYDDSHTGGVGTTIYIAPELTKAYGRSHYNKKVDIYSLGIIFFEMCHPFKTNMEKSKIISDLRHPDVIIPASIEANMPKQMELIRSLLNHDPKSRPSCQEILEGDSLPPPQIEDEDVQEFVKNTLSNPESKAYKHLISSCFNQKPNKEENLTYNLEKVRSEKLPILMEIAKKQIERILTGHCAVYLSTPLLLPKSDVYTNVDSCVNLMTHSGSIVYLPYDLRVPFARYVASKEITRLRRYSIDRVYREKKVHGFHPKEMHECAFDIVTPTPGNLTADSEMLIVLNEIVNQLPSLKSRNCFIRLNHTCLLKAILVHFKAEKYYSDIFKILVEAKENKYPRNRLEMDLLSIKPLADQAYQFVQSLTNHFLKEDVMSRVTTDITKLLKGGDALALAKRGLQDLKTIINNAEYLGLNIPIKVSLGTVYNVEFCSGVMFDLVCETKQKKKRDGCEILASGCRYDNLLTKFRQVFEMTGRFPKDITQSGVGMSVSLDKIAFVLKEDNPTTENVIICSLAQNFMLREMADLVKTLRSSEIKCYIEEDFEKLEELQNFGQENKATHIVGIKDKGMALVMSWENNRKRYQEKTTPISDVPDHIIRFRFSKMSSDHSDTNLIRSESKTSNEFQGGNPKFNIHIIPEDKLTGDRKKYETQIKTRISQFLVENFSSRSNIEIVGVFLKSWIVNTLAANFALDDDTKEYLEEVQTVIQKSPKKKYLQKICDKIRTLYTEKSNVLVFIYSIDDGKYNLICGS